MAADPERLPKDLEREAVLRLTRARRNKLPFERNMREGYFFAAPHRAANVLSASQISDWKPDDAGMLNTSFGYELCTDFPNIILNTFMPEDRSWARRRVGDDLFVTERKQLENEVEKSDAAIFRAIAASNFYPMCGEAFMPDLALGTVAMLIESGRPGSPVRCQPVPIRELEISLGPYGGIDDRFISRWTRNSHIEELLSDIKLPEDVKQEIKKQPEGKINVSWGFWRLWGERTEKWQHVILLKEKLVHQTEITGAGSCPLIVGRFGSVTEWPWGVGPLIQALPDLLHIDALCEGKIKNIDLSLQPPISWPDDSWTNISGGIESGMAYKVRPGSEAAIKKIYEPSPQDAAVYEYSLLEQRLRRMFYLDFPFQPGKTPATATQWLDQSTMAQRRIGTIGRLFWAEFAAGVFIRFKHLLEAAGTIQPIKIDGRTAFLQPYNPAQLAAEQQEVLQFTQFVQIAAGAAPEEFKYSTDGAATIRNLAAKMGASKIWVERDEAQIAESIKQIAQLQAGQAPAVPTIGSPGPPVQ